MEKLIILICSINQIDLLKHVIAMLAAECRFCAAKLVLWRIHTVAAQKQINVICRVN